ncbi:putative porphobilinogen synthase [Dioscorea sansibarensis]
MLLLFCSHLKIRPSSSSASSSSSNSDHHHHHHLGMASTISYSLGNVGVVRGIEDQRYIGLRPLTAQIRFHAVPSVKAQRSVHVRASNEQETKVKSSGMSIEECEAAAVAGKFPDPSPFVRPSGPKGTPVITALELTKRPRRNRKSPALRAAFQETILSPANFVHPLFIHEGEEDTPIGAMPGCFRLGWRHGLLDEVYKARDVGVNSFVLFPKVPDALKSATGDEAYNDNGLIPRSIRLLKDKYPDIVIYTDVALDPYSSDGHDGIVREDGVIMNDETVHQLCKQAVSQARAGADVVSPSDMMDGRVGAIRAALDAEGFHDVSIMSYTAKYASAFYGPFREALDSNPRFGDKKTYQMNPANYREALIETEADEAEGADILLVKPALPYLDVVRLLRDNSALPIAAYQVSGEYSMIKAGGVLKMIDEEKVMMESLLCIKRAGADIILTYFARQAASVLCGMR